GGIEAKQNTPLTIISSTISFNRATANDGGGIYAKVNSPVTITDSLFFANYARGSEGGGGGIFVYNDSSLFIQNSTIISNATNRHGGGGGIAAKNNSPVMIDSSYILSNTDDDKGGGIYAYERSPVTIQNSTIASNTAPYGGGIYVTDYTPITITTNSEIRANRAMTNGGGIYAKDNSTVTVESSSVVSNSAGVNGGGIYAKTSSGVIVTNSEILSNTTTTDGGGIYAKDTSPVTVTANSRIAANKTLSGDGGGIYTQNISPIVMQDSTLLGNVSSNRGGGIYAQINSPVTIQHSQILSNTARVDGGGIYAARTSPLVVQNSTIMSNTVPDQGGGIYARQSSTVTVENSYIVGNQSTADVGEGGGVYVGGYSPLFVTNSHILSNTAKKAGGGIYALTSSPVTVQSSHILYNVAELKGGGIYSQGPLTVTDNSEIRANVAMTKGGGIYMYKNTLTVINSSIAENSAKDGGGIYANQSDISITGSQLLTNTATSGTGGGLYYKGNGSKTQSIQESCIMANSDTAIHNNTTNTITAQSNWWGASDGAGSVATGSGDTISTYVDASNFSVINLLDCPILPVGPDITVDSPTVDENTGAMQFTLSLSASHTDTVSIDYQTTLKNPVDALDVSDFISSTGTLNIPAGSTSGQVSIPLVNDNVDEGDEGFILTFLKAVNGILTSAFTEGTIGNDDHAVLSVNSPSANETDGVLTFRVQLSNPFINDVTVSYHTENISALDGTHFTGQSGTQTIPAGATGINVTVPIDNLDIAQGNRTFQLVLTGVSAVPVGTANGIGTIVDNNFPTATPTSTPTSTGTPTPTLMSTSTPTSTAMGTPTSTPTLVVTPTATLTSTVQPMGTPTSTALSTTTATATTMPTAMSTMTPTVSSTVTSTVTPISTATPTPTSTSAPVTTPTATPTSAPMASPTATPVPIATSMPTTTPDTPSTITIMPAPENVVTLEFGDGTAVTGPNGEPGVASGDSVTIRFPLAISGLDEETVELLFEFFYDDDVLGFNRAATVALLDALFGESGYEILQPLTRQGGQTAVVVIQASVNNSHLTNGLLTMPIILDALPHSNPDGVIMIGDRYRLRVVDAGVDAGNGELITLAGETDFFIPAAEPTNLDETDEPSQPKRWYSFLPWIGR
ncbi:MAG: right-handed parallel beta-helix repeat-containing protein, partial [Chloroflexota bacterium]